MFGFIKASNYKAQAPIQINHTLFNAEKGISTGFIIVAGTATILALQAISFLAQMVATPIIVGICIGLAVHIALYGPKESIDCVKEIAQNTIRAISTFIEKTPIILQHIVDTAKRASHDALQTIGRRVNPRSKTQYTVREVAIGLVLEGKSKLEKAHKKK